MALKKLTFCVLCFVNAANLANEEVFNDEKFSNSGIEENILTNKNTWNTRKWGSIYFLFPHVSFSNIICKFCDVIKSAEDVGKDDSALSFRGTVKSMPLRLLNFILSGVVEYKWMFHKYCGINVRFNLNNMEPYEPMFSSFFSFEPSLEWNYGKKGEHFFSGSFSPLGVAVMQNENDGKFVKDHCKKMLTLSFILLKYEYDRRFYLNFGKLKTSWYSIFTCFDELAQAIFFNFLSIEFGLNIIGVNDWRKSKNYINDKL